MGKEVLGSDLGATFFFMKFTNKETGNPMTTLEEKVSEIAKITNFEYFKIMEIINKNLPIPAYILNELRRIGLKIPPVKKKNGKGMMVSERSSSASGDLTLMGKEEYEVFKEKQENDA